MTEIKDEVSIQFVKGKNEKVHPEIRLFRELDRKKGKAVALESANKNKDKKIYAQKRIKIQGKLDSLYRNFH